MHLAFDSRVEIQIYGADGKEISASIIRRFISFCFFSEFAGQYAVDL